MAVAEEVYIILNFTYLNKVFLFIAASFWYLSLSYGQEVWPNPEVAQMHEHALEYLKMGNYKDAIVTLRQLNLLVPGKTKVLTELGNALYMNAEFDNAIAVLEPAIEKKDATDITFQLLAASQVAKKQNNKAESTVKGGLKHFRNSGPLMNELGQIYLCKKDEESALSYFQEGLHAAPGFPENYRDAANIYLQTKLPLWGLLFGETYLSMPHDTTGDEEVKEKLYKAWKNYFDNLSDYTIKELPTDFEKKVNDEYRQLTPVVSDGVTVENLVMARARFLMDWWAENNKQFPLPLFSYQDEMMRNGWFDIYNEWLFGKQESAAQFEAWNKFHEGDMAKFLAWQLTHPLKPASAPLYFDQSDKKLKTVCSQKIKE